MLARLAETVQDREQLGTQEAQENHPKTLSAEGCIIPVYPYISPIYPNLTPDISAQLLDSSVAHLRNMLQVLEKCSLGQQ